MEHIWSYGELMRFGMRQRKGLVILGLGVASLLVLWISLPFWFPWVLRPLAERAGVHYARFEREGYGRFSLYALSYTNGSVRIGAQRVEALTPSVWFWRLAAGTEKQAAPFLAISGWHLESLPTTATTGGSVYSEAQELAADLKLLRRWMPLAVLSNGTVRVENTLVEIPALNWSRGNLNFGIEVPKLKVSLSGILSTEMPYELRIRSEPLHLFSNMRLSTNLSGLDLQSTNLWWSNRVEAQAQFGRTGNLPEQASLQARDFRIPPELLQMPDYGEIVGSLDAKWQAGQFVMDLKARARPQTAQTNLPPLDLELHAHGDTNSAVVETARLSSPWLRAELSRGLALDFTGQLLRERADLRLSVDLTRQPWLLLRGTLNGEADFSPATGKFPIGRFHLSGVGVGTQALEARSFEVAGELNWPWLRISEVHAAFNDSSTASVSANLQMIEKVIEAGRFAFAGPLVRRWLPPGYSYQDLAVTGQMHGPFNELTHSGHLQITNLVTPDLRSVNVALDWQGKQTNLNPAVVEISSGRSSLSAQGALNIEGVGVNLTLDQLTLRRDGKPLLALDKSVDLSFSKRPGSEASWLASVNSLHWAGSAGDLSLQAAVDWPGSGSLEVSAKDFDSELVADVLKAKIEPFALRALTLSAGWTNGPMNYALEVSAAGNTNIPFAAELKLSGGAKGLSLPTFRLLEQSSPVISAQGFLPLTINPGPASKLVQMDRNARLHLEAVTVSQGALWDRITAWTGIGLRQPHLSLNISGTANAPQGQVELQVQHLQLPKSKQPMPALDDLRLDLQFDRLEARMTDFHLLVQGQPVTLTGALPLGDSFWAGLAKMRVAYLEKASGHLRIEKAELASVAVLYPVLSPQGELSADLSLRPGLSLEGQLTVQHGRTGALPSLSLGPLREIDLKMTIRERTLRLERATANLGGGELQMTGLADLRGTNWLKDILPPFAFSLLGTNVPLAQQPGAIVRGDLMLAATRTNGAPPLISGTVNLRDSYFLTDLTALIPGTVATPSQRPPYFSVDSPFLANWRLAVHVTGDRFLKVRTTVFNGEVSANLTLQGNLEDPMALGDVRIDSGNVSFPFGSLAVQQGFVTLSSANPYQPQLAVNATSKQFGYTIKMEVSGPANAPVIQFTSTPPLSSEQILLLLTTGALPRGAFSLTAQQRAQTFAMFLAQDLMTKLGIGGTGEQRLTIRSGEEISQTGKPTYSIEFKLNKDWSVVAEYDRFGDYDAGFKWRVYSK